MERGCPPKLELGTGVCACILHTQFGAEGSSFEPDLCCLGIPPGWDNVLLPR